MYLLYKPEDMDWEGSVRKLGAIVQLALGTIL